MLEDFGALFFFRMRFNQRTERFVSRMKHGTIDFLHGRILPSLARLALPIMATSMVQTAYNLTDMAWIGRVGSQAVTAVGVAGMYTWLSGGIVTLARMGSQIKVAHSLGEGKKKEAAVYAAGGLQLTILLAVIFGLITNIFSDQLIGFFGVNSTEVLVQAKDYLRITCGLIIFTFLNQTITGIFTAIGDSRTPFAANCAGLVINMVLDPLLIFGFGPVPAMGTVGAAVATVTAQMAVTLLLVVKAVKDTYLFSDIHITRRIEKKYFDVILKLGLPSSLQSMLYCGISMVLTKLIAGWGDGAVAVQRVGGQIECISWTTAEGFGSAMSAFSGQNFGAKLYDRVKKSYVTAVAVLFVWGLFTSGLMIFGAEAIFKVFIQEPEVVAIGAGYLVIIGYSQMFMCQELMTVGALQGLGKTFSASVITIILTGVRIPLAIFLSQTAMGLDGIWWALSLSSIVKGIIFVGYYGYVLKKLPVRQGTDR